MWTKPTSPQTAPCPGNEHGRLAGWSAWLLGRLLVLALLAGAGTACDPVGNVTVNAPDVSETNNAHYVDTLTVRMATVWHDSVVTSTSANLLVGRYRDPRLGVVTARSYFRLGFSAAYAPATGEVFDSLVLVLKPDGYTYGDTTRQQTVEVHRLRDPLEDNKTYFAFSQLGYEAAALNQGMGARAFRARPTLRTLRLPLADALGRELLAAGKAGRLSTEAELNYLLAGLVLTPGATDDATLLRSQLSTDGAALNLYTHAPTTPATAITQAFSLAASTKHFYQVTSDRTGTLFAPLNTSLQALDVAQTAEESYIDGALGLQTKLEIPYLKDLLTFGTRLTIVQAHVTLEVVPGTYTRYLAPPASLVAYLSGRGNKLAGLLSTSSGTALTAPYVSAISTRTGLETGSYGFYFTDYCQAVVDRTVENTGILLTSAGGPERAVLGGPKRSENRLRLELYFLSN